jgi:hypothetical protein
MAFPSRDVQRGVGLEVPFRRTRDWPARGAGSIGNTRLSPYHQVRWQIPVIPAARVDLAAPWGSRQVRERWRMDLR